MIDWNSSITWGIIGLIGGFLVSLLFYFLSKRTKILAYEINSTVLITNEMSQIPGLSIIFENDVIENLTTSTIFISNVGKDVINYEDFASLDILKIDVIDGNLLVLDDDLSKYVSNISDKKINLNLEKNSQGCNILFEFIKPKAFFSLTVLHTGNLQVSGTLKNGKVLDNYLRTKKMKKFFFIGLVVLILLIIFFIFIKQIIAVILIVIMLNVICGISDSIFGK